MAKTIFIADVPLLKREKVLYIISIGEMQSADKIHKLNTRLAPSCEAHDYGMNYQ